MYKCQEMMNIEQESSLDYLYHKKYYKCIGIDLSRQTNTTIFQQINFIGKLEQGNCGTVFSLLKSSKKLF